MANKAWSMLKGRVLQSPMAGAHDHQLAVAVTRAGGIGAIPGAMLSLDDLKRETDAFGAQIPRNEQGLLPINLNFFCHAESTADSAVLNTWPRQTLSQYYTEFGVDVNTALQVPFVERKSFNRDTLKALKAIRPAIVSFHFGLPPQVLLVVLKSELASTLVISSATTLEEARFLDSMGCDAIIVQGSEAGGHRAMFLPSSTRVEEQVGLFSLLISVRNALPKQTIIAAGGIGDAKAVQAAKAMGADAIQVGSCLLLTKEANKISPLHRSSLSKFQSEHMKTALTNVFTGRPARGIVNRLMKDLNYVDLERVPPFPRAGHALIALKSAAERTGKDDFTPMWSGQAGPGEIGKEFEGQSAFHVIQALVDCMNRSPSLHRATL